MAFPSLKKTSLETLWRWRVMIKRCRAAVKEGWMEKEKKSVGGRWGLLIEQVKYTEREEGCLLVLPANGERQ